jgi:hypothetical protein
MRIGAYTNLIVVLSVRRVAVVHLDAIVAIEEHLTNTVISCACDEAFDLGGTSVLKPCIVWARLSE